MSKKKPITIKRTFSRLFFLALLIVCMELILLLSLSLSVSSLHKRSVIVPILQQTQVVGLDQSSYKILRLQLQDLVLRRDPRVALNFLKNKMAHDSKVMASCHELLHDLGKQSYEKYHDFAKAMQFRDETCISGYTHGVIEAYFTTSPQIFSHFTSVCAHYQSGTYVRWECNHGIGHGLMYFTANNLPYSLKKCLQFTKTSDQDACASGIYMENFNSDLSLHPSRYVSFSDPLKPCREYNIYPVECYSTAPIFFLNYRNYDFSGALAWCDSAPVFYRQYCYRGVGEQMARRQFASPVATEQLCSSQGKKKQLPCISEMVSWYLDYYASEKELMPVCNKLRPEDKQMCLQEAEESVRTHFFH